MRLSNVRSAAASFTLLVVGVAALVAWLVQPHRAATGPDDSAPRAAVGGEQGGLDGAALFGANCTTCHAVDELTPPLRGPEPALAALAMLEFLADHGEGDAAEDLAMVRFLVRSAR